MKSILLIGWNAEEAAERSLTIRRAGYDVQIARPVGPPGPYLRKLVVAPPAAAVIDLDRLPSQGRDIGIILRRMKPTRQIPLVFAGGVPEKVARVKALLPDATYSSWASIRQAMKRALLRPLANPVVPGSSLAGYSGTPLPKKLGIGENSKVAVIDAPAGFVKELGSLPVGVKLKSRVSAGCELLLWFVRSVDDFDAKLAAMANLIGDRPMWIVWAKKSSAMFAGIDQQRIRTPSLEAGLVDYKVASITDDWTGLLFKRRKPQKTTSAVATPGRASATA